MPELPEVEITRRLLEPHIVGRTIAAVQTTAPSYFFITRPSVLRRKLAERTIVSLERRGKYLLLGLDSGARLLLHLGMTGQLFMAGTTSPRLLSERRRKDPVADDRRFEPDRHTHLCVDFSDGRPGLLFRDVRKFGKVLLLEGAQSDPRLDKLGVDALEVTADYLYAKTRGRRAPIKSVLLDQSVLAGVGNIYADEALFMSGVRPARSASRLSASECAALAENVRRVLLRSIETGGSSISDFIAPDGSDGHFQSERKVYAREGEGCGLCSAVIRRVVIGQRSSHYCPRCQR